jgi:uncharacterized protein (TIGR03083 family)
VPTCPDWNAADLLWHLAEVQWFWGTVVRDGIDGAAAEARKPERPRDRQELHDFFAASSRELVGLLGDKAPESHAWTWSPEQTVGFVRRRQAHEALIHRVDAELAAGSRTPMGPALSADGVDEALRVMYGGVPPWGSFAAEAGKTIRVRATDTGHTWLVRLGQFSGTDPDTETTYQEPDLSAADADTGEDTTAGLEGTAADLDCWLWHRPTVEPVVRTGDSDVLHALDTVISPGIN